MKPVYLFILVSILISCTKSDSGEIPADTQSPSVPENIAATNTNTNSTTLSWSVATDDVNVAGYKIYQDGSEIDETVDTTYQVLNLATSTTYVFEISAFDTSDNESARSVAVDVTTGTPGDTEPPLVPENLIASNTTTSSTTLTWDASTDNIGVSAYKIYQDGTEIEQVANTTYQVEGLTASTTYKFEVSAVDSSNNESARSESLNVTTETSADTEPPTTPENLVATNTTTTTTELSWDASTDNETVSSYKIYQDGTEIGQVANTMYQVEGLTASTTYAFEVSAVDSSNNESARSEVLNVTTNDNTSSRPKVLVFTKTNGFNHNTKDESIAMVEQIAAQQNFDVETDDNGDSFNSLENLNQYDIIFFTNTSGNTLNNSQRDNVESYAAQGGNFISNHAASDSYGHSTASTVSGNGKGEWDWYAEHVTGCSVRNSPNHTPAGFDAVVSIQNENTALTANISFPWNDSEEWYYWEGGYLNNTFTELLRVSDTGNNSYDDPRMTAHYWERPDGGISFYTSMGHAKNKYSDEEFIQLISNVFSSILN